MKKVLSAFTLIVFVACNSSSSSSKLFVITNGDFDKASSGSVIKISDGSSYAEKEFDVADKNVKATVGSSSKTTTLEGEGYFLWNLKKDTLVGAKQNIGTADRSTVTITQEMLQQKIDSLTALSENKNVSTANKN